MIQAEKIAKLKSLILLNTEKAQDLLNLLTEEYEVLRHADPAPLESMTPKKAALIKSVEKSASQLQAWFESQNLNCDTAGVDKFFSQIDDKSRDILSGIWEKMRQTITALSERNIVNGTVIFASRTRLLALLEVLTHKGELPLKTYGRKGHVQKSSASSGHLEV